MRRPDAAEIACVLAGAVLVVWGAWLLPVPPAVHPLWLYKARAGKFAIAALGALALLWAWGSWRRPQPLLSESAWRERLTRLALAGGGVLVTVAIVEGLLQWLTPSPPANWIRPDERLHHAQKASFSTRFISPEWDTAVVTNRLGLRDVEIGPKAPGVVRVLVLGDSYTFGYGVEAAEAYPQVLAALAREAALPVESVNAGIPSYSPTLEALWLRDLGLSLSPDVVVLGLDMSDLQDDLFLEPLVEWGVDGEPARARPSPRPGKLAQWYKSLLLVRMARFAAEAAYRRSASGEEFEAPQVRQLLHNRFALTRDDVSEAEAGLHYRRTFAWLDRMRTLLAKHDVRFLVLTYPYGHQVATNEWESGRLHYGFATGKVYNDEPARRLSAWATERQVPYLDLFPAFRAAADGTYYFAQDGHFTPKAHRLAAELLLARLRELGWIGPPAASHHHNHGDDSSG
ncbi:MAG: SGNH/GDSL hydrolase family protein [Thermoanaerobaculia bacterium]